MKIKNIVSNIKNQIISINCPSGLFNKTSLSKLPAKVLNMPINGLAINSKLAREGYLFFCLSGTRYKGADFISEAYSNGANAIILENNIKVNVPIVAIKVSDVISCLGDITNEFYGHPSDTLNMTAITGTNGKTTITFIIENILKTFRKNTGIMGTINYRFGNDIFPAFNTTPDIITINSLLKQMIDQKIKFLIMEVSSHALAQRRIEGLKFNQAIFTNLTQDHFDYHKTKQKYFLAKSVLFSDYIKNGGAAIINIDDIYGRKLINIAKKNRKRIITYGIKNKADISAKNIRFNRCGCQFTAEETRHKFNIDTNLIGIFNVYNALAAIAASLELNIPEKYIIEGLRNVYVPGRLEKVVCKREDISIFIDYAHTEDGLKNVLMSLNRLKCNGRLIVVFGCGGDRDKSKRPKMGRVATELADFSVITSDNPRSEDPEAIIIDIKKGIKRNNYTAIADRKEAIEAAVNMVRGGDILLVAGKGHEDYQIIKDKRFAFNDRLIIEAILSKKGLI